MYYRKCQFLAYVYVWESRCRCLCLFANLHMVWPAFLRQEQVHTPHFGSKKVYDTHFGSRKVYDTHFFQVATTFAMSAHSFPSLMCVPESDVCRAQTVNYWRHSRSDLNCTALCVTGTTHLEILHTCSFPFSVCKREPSNFSTGRVVCLSILKDDYMMRCLLGGDTDCVWQIRKLLHPPIATAHFRQLGILFRFSTQTPRGQRARLSAGDVEVYHLVKWDQVLTFIESSFLLREWIKCTLQSFMWRWILES